MISYSLYLWQQLFTLPSLHGSWTNNIGVAVVAPLAIAELSWRVMEEPLGRVRKRFA
jgi:peptidoglycan/LPS O-acetylase OafA/YrhL